MAQTPPKRNWWFRLRLGRAGDKMVFVNPDGKGDQWWEDDDFEYRVEVITKSGERYTSVSGNYHKRRQELEAGK